MFYKNALQAIWLDYTTKYIVKQDINLIDNFDEESEENLSIKKKNSMLTSQVF